MFILVIWRKCNEHNEHNLFYYYPANSIGDKCSIVVTHMNMNRTEIYWFILVYTGLYFYGVHNINFM